MTSLDERADALIVAWQEARSTGAPTSLDALLDENPDLAEALRERAKALLAMESAFAPSGQALEAGARLGPFRVLRQLGHGGMGVVHEALVEEPNRGLEPGHHVALKFVHPHLLASGDFFGRFLREAELGRRIRHPNLVRTYGFDAILAEGVPHRFLVMDYVHGQTLRQLLGDLEVVPEDLCHHIALEVAKGLAAMHEAGAVHRDLKPENVIITDDHEVRIMDLGVAQTAEGALSITKTGQFLGSIQYAAPEQFRGQPLDGRADLHALGVVLYELATGEHPYRDEDAHVVLGRVLGSAPRRAGECNPQLSPFFEEVVHTLLAKDREQRFASASELAGVLDAGEESEWWTARAMSLRAQTGRPLRRIRIPRETSLYGREEDLTHLHALYDQAKGGEGQVLLLEGEAGIGKTRLVDEFVGRLRQQGEDIDFLFGSYPPGGAATASGAFSEAYREHYGAEDLEQALEGHLSSVPLLIPAFAALLKGDAPPKDEEPLTKDSLQTVFVHATRGLASERTTIVLIDDLHFAPEDGRALFTSLALAVPEHRILLIGTMRPGVPEAWTTGVTRLEHAAQRVLSRLGPKDLGKLFRDVFRSERLADELGWRIAEKSDGNPFFAFEIIRGLKEGQFITQQPDGTWVTSKIIHDIEVPDSVLDLVNARVADLSAEEREILDVASCCGFEFDGSLVAGALHRERIPIFRALGHIEQKHRLVRASGRRHVFDHHQVQEALYGSLSEVLKEEYHSAIAEALEARTGAFERDPTSVEGALCVQLSEHYLRGGQGGKALRYLHQALKHLAGGYHHSEVVALAERALGPAHRLPPEDRISVLLCMCEALENLGRAPAEENALREAHKLAQESLVQTSPIRIEWRLGALMWRLGRHEDAMRHARRALDIARDRGDRVGEGRTLGSLGTYLLTLGRSEEASAHYKESLRIARESGDAAGEALALGCVGVACYQRGHFDQAASYHKAELDLARKLGNRKHVAHVFLNLAPALWDLGCREEAWEMCEQMLEVARKIGSRWFEAEALGHLGVTARLRHRYDEALRHLELSVALLRETGVRSRESVRRVHLGDTHRFMGSYGKARDQYGTALELAEAQHDAQTQARALIGLAFTAEGMGEEDEALDLATRARRMGNDVNSSVVVLSRLLIGELYRRVGQSVKAREELQELIANRRDQEPLSEALVYATVLMACLPGGDTAAAEAALEEAGEAGNSPDARYHLWKATGKHEHLAEAKRLLDYRVEHAPEEYRESMLKNVRLNREIMEAWAEHGEKEENE